MQVIVQFFKEMNPLRLAAAAASLLAFLVLFIVLIARIGDDEFAVLYTDLEMQDSAKIAEELDHRKISYKTMPDGSTIMVHKSEVVSTRLTLAQIGLPNSGSVVGYEIFDKEDSLGATNFSQNIKLIRALEGELSRTISAFDQVAKARVHLVIPQREIFSKERMEPRASVILKFKGAKRLGRPEIDAISHLVVMSVPGLEMKSVTIVDTKGRALKIGSSEESSNYSSGKNEEIRIAEETRLRSVIIDLLESTIGSGKVKAQVALDMNFDRVVTNSELYDPEGAVVRSVQSIDQKEKTPISSGGGGDASVANNIPGGSGAEDSAGSFAIIENSDQTTNYEISKTVKNHISESGVIKKMSIGILVDGIYSTNPETHEVTYSPRSQEDLDKIANLVKVAIGFDDDRSDKIEVINMRFSSELDSFDEDNMEWLREELPSLFQTIVFAIVVLLVLITVIRPIALKAFEIKKTDELFNEVGADVLGVPKGSMSSTPGMAMPSGGQDAMPGSLNVAVADGQDGNNTEAKVNPIKKVNEIVESNPQELVNILRKWLNEDT
jgi:flagellar M-ring protein FliF